MSSYLEFLQKLQGYKSVQDLTTGDSVTVLTATNDLFGSQAVDAKTREANFTPEKMDSSRRAHTETEQFFNDGALLTYPQDLFQPGNTAYIYFQMTDSENMVIDKDFESKNPNTSPMDGGFGSSAPAAKRIALYMPASVKVNYGTRWEDAPLQVRKSIGLGKQMFSAGYEDALQQVGARVIDAFTGSEEFKNDLEFTSKKILDPSMALLFKGVNFREFQFDFQMLARNREESQAIRQIIKAFKYAMLPGQPKDSSGNTGAIWSYPYFFEIYLCSPSRTFMFNIMNCALTQMEVDYGGSGIPSFFRENGAPVDIRMSLQFKELFLLTKNMVLNDY